MTLTEPTDQFGDKSPIEIIDDLARDDPTRSYAKVPRGKTFDEGYRTITAAELATAINQAAWWLEKQLKNHPPGPKTIGYIGPHDLRYIALTLGAVKTGNQLFLPSLLNNPETNVALLDAFKCSIFLVPEGEKFRTILNPLAQKRQLEYIDVPELTFYFDVPGQSVPHYPWSRDANTARHTPLAGMQSSGSTGTPKPIQITLGHMMSFQSLRRLKGEKETAAAYFGGGRNFLALSPFCHASGLMLGTMGLPMEFVLVTPSATEPLTVERICDLIDQQDIRAGAFSPPLFAGMLASPAGAKSLSKLDCTFFGGGPLPSKIGDQVAKLTKVTPAYGGTEFGLCLTEHIDPEDWAYMKFPAALGVEMRPYDDQLYECVFVRKPECKAFQAVFMQYPDCQEWATKDLFSKHPTKLELWKYHGRTDDVIVFSNAYKLDPVGIENAVSGHPGVKGALVCGMSRSHSSIIIEASPTLKDELWPTIQLANEKMYERVRVRKDMILFATPEKPFPRAGKGTIQRRLAIELYKPELDALYDSVKDVL